MTTERFLRARDLLLSCRTDYERACAEFRWPELSRWNWALDFFDVMAHGNQALALHLLRDGADAAQGPTETRRSFAELADRSAQLANHLRRIGVRRGERVLVMLPNTVELWESLLALMKLGAVMAPATTLLPVADLLMRVQRGDIRHVIVDGACAAHVAALPAQVTKILVGGPRVVDSFDFYASHAESSHFVPDGVTQASDPFLLYFTSGTTAQPKLVLHTHQSYPVGHLSTMYWIGMRPGDVHYNISSPGWAKHAWSSVFAPWNAGAAVLSHHYARFSAADTLALLVRAGVNTLCAPPTVWRLLLLGDLGARPPALRELCSAGEPLNPEVIERVRAAWGLTIRDGFGQTETTALIGNSPGQPVRAGSMGRPLPGYHMALLDAPGQPVSATEGEGEIAVVLSPPSAPRPLGVMVGYCDDAERTAAAMAGGYYRTGDEASRDADGYYHYIGRGDDVFKSSDYRISPFELESALLEHPSVAEAAVVPSPDPLRLAVPKAFVVLRPGVAPDRDAARALFTFVKQRLAPYLRIRRIEFAELPKTVSGKIRRVALRQLERDRAAAPRVDFRIEDFSD
jgi:acetyl-CoA synthetase